MLVIRGAYIRGGLYSGGLHSGFYGIMITIVSIPPQNMDSPHIYGRTEAPCELSLFRNSYTSVQHP